MLRGVVFRRFLCFWIIVVNVFDGVFVIFVRGEEGV